jgi:hypothetical protein
MTETEKLAALISSGSPVVSTFIPASVFVSAEVRTAKLSRVAYSGSEWIHGHYVVSFSLTDQIRLLWHYCFSLLYFLFFAYSYHR